VYFPHGSTIAFNAARIDVDHRGTTAELSGDFTDKLRCAHCGRIDAYLLGASLNQPRGIVEGPNAATYGKGHEYLIRHPPDNIKHGGTAFVAGTDVKKNQLVGPIFLIAPSNLDWISGVTQIQKVNAFHDAAAVDVETGDDAFGEHGKRPGERRTLVRRLEDGIYNTRRVDWVLQ
jgi:hypothetical protein